MKFFSTRIILLLIFFSTTPALALPAPLPQETLAQKSEIIATVRVLGVARVNDIKEFDQMLPVYQAWMQIIHIKKGPFQPQDTLLVQWHDLPKGLLGPWHVPYKAGEIVETYLIKDPKSILYYTTTWWNAAHILKESEVPLPPQRGDFVLNITKNPLK